MGHAWGGREGEESAPRIASDLLPSGSAITPSFHPPLSHTHSLLPSLPHMHFLPPKEERVCFTRNAVPASGQESPPPRG